MGDKESDAEYDPFVGGNSFVKQKELVNRKISVPKRRWEENLCVSKGDGRWSIQ